MRIIHRHIYSYGTGINIVVIETACVVDHTDTKLCGQRKILITT